MRLIVHGSYIDEFPPKKFLFEANRPLGPRIEHAFSELWNHCKDCFQFCTMKGANRDIDIISMAF